MRYTRTALLTFGAGLGLGLVIVAFGLDPLGRLASGLMALGIAALPPALIVDLWPAIRRRRRPVPARSKTRAKPKAPTRRPAAAAPRRLRARRPAAPKR
jgi:hypothetical protein